VALAVAFGLSAAFGGEFTNGSTAPGSDSAQAQSLLGERFPAQSGDTVKVVVRAADVGTAEVRGAVKALLGELGRMPHVTSVEDPYATKSSITPDGRTLVARLYLDVLNPNDMPVEDTERLLAATKVAERDGLKIALGGRAAAVETAQDPDLDDIRVGELEGRTLADYRAWKRARTRRDPFPGGESLDDAARRYARAFRKLLERPESSILVVAHEIPLRYAINAADGSDDLDGPAHQLANATPYLFDRESLVRAVEGIERLT